MAPNHGPNTMATGSATIRPGQIRLRTAERHQVDGQPGESGGHCDAETTTPFACHV